MKLSNGATIYKFGKPKLFVLAGVHGEEVSPIVTLNQIIGSDLKDVWILPCLNVKGFKEMTRKDGKYNLNDEFKFDSELTYMSELCKVLEEIKPDMFVDMHEDCESDVDYIWTHKKNDINLDGQLKDTGIFVHPGSDFYKGTSETFMRNLGCRNAFTTEVTTEKPLEERIKKNKLYFNYFYNQL